jgi:hypothetical protein
MTVSSTVNRNDYVGNGATTVYPYTFQIYDQSHIEVWIQTLAGTVSKLTLATDYTVSGVNLSGGGNITLTTALTSGYLIAVKLVLPLTQLTDLKNQGRFFGEVHERVFDRDIRIAQQLADQYSRGIKLPETEIGSTLKTTIPVVSQRASKLLGFDENGNPTSMSFSYSSDVTVNNIASLMLIVGDGSKIAKTQGYYAAGDGGDNSFYWDSTSTSTDNGGTIIKPTSVIGAGRWLAVNPLFVTFAQFGGKKNDISAAVANFTALKTACQALGGTTSPTGTKGTLYIQQGTYTIANDEIRTTGGFKIVGDGAGVSVLSVTNTLVNDFFNFKDGGNVVLEDFSIVGEYNDEALPAYASTPNTTLIDFRNSDNNFISNVAFTRIWGRCINLTSSKNTHLNNFDIECIYNGFQINDDSLDLTKDVWVTNGIFRGFAVGGFLAESDDSLYLLENVYIDNVTCVGHVSQVAAQGISFTKSTTTNASDFEKHKNIHMTNCRISDCFQASAFRGGRGVFYSNIQTNNCTRGFDIGNGNAVHDLFMSDIVVNGVGGGSSQGIIVFSGDAATPSSNTNNVNIENVVMRGVCASTAALLINAETFSVKNIKIFGDGTASSVAIETQSKAAKFTISDCYVSDFVATAYKLNGTSTAKARIYSNTATGGSTTTSKGIDIQSTSTSISVFDNDVITAVTTPITILNAYRHDNIGYDVFFGSMTYDAPSIPAGQMVTQLVTCTGAVAGDYASGSFTNLSTGIQITYEAGSNAVLCTISNSNTVAVDMGSGTLRVKTVKK